MESDTVMACRGVACDARGRRQAAPLQRAAWGLLLLLVPHICLAAPDGSAPTPNQAESDRRDQANLAAFATNPAVLVLPGVVADRARQEVRLLAESTKITPSDPLEFLLIGQDSDHGYESLAVCFARPSAVYQALCYIRLTPGRPANARGLAFWPKGERVLLSVRNLGTNGWFETIPVEELLWDSSAAAPPSVTGQVFVESGQAGEPGQASEAYLPDIADPHSIASTYNEEATVMDVPRIAVQGSVYGRLKANPARLLPPHTLLEFVLRPERPADKPRVLDLTLTVLPGPAAPLYALSSAMGSINDSPAPSAVLTQIVAHLVRDGRDPFVRVRFDPRLRLDTLHATATFLESLEREDGLRLEPPEPDQLFFRAFLPDERNRRREDRVAQPLELRLTRTPDGALHASLTKIKETWRDDRPEPDLAAEDFPLQGPDDMLPKLEQIGSSLPVLLVFAPPDVTLAELMPYLAPVRLSHRLVHIYVEPVP